MANQRFNRRWLTLIVALLPLAAGCNDSSSAGSRAISRPGKTKGDLLPSVSVAINHLEDFDNAQILPQVRDWLNQWIQNEKPTTKWEPDRLLKTLPDELQKLKIVETLGNREFTQDDVRFVQENIWMRDISRAARANDFSGRREDADQFADLPVAQRLFDWTVRNIQLERDPGSADPKRRWHAPGEVLLLGRGTAVERGWLFILLARQQGIDAVMLALPDSDQPDGVRPWLPAALVDGQLYLFDPRLGLPLPGPGGKGIATLAQAASDASVLRQLDLEEDRRYPVSAEELTGLVAFVEASPHYLSRRMKLLGTHLAGKSQVVLWVDASDVAKRTLAAGPVAAARLWPLPYRVWQAQIRPSAADQQQAREETVLFHVLPDLINGRIHQFKHDFDGDKGAKKVYLHARPSEQELRKLKLPPELDRELQAKGRNDPKLRQKIIDEQVKLHELGKQSATLWLGLIAFEEHSYPVAVEDFSSHLLEEFPAGPWTNAARYNLARSYEASGRPAEAIKIYEADKSPQKDGNRLRARMLKANLPASGEADPAEKKQGDG